MLIDAPTRQRRAAQGFAAVAAGGAVEAAAAILNEFAPLPTPTKLRESVLALLQGVCSFVLHGPGEPSGALGRPRGGRLWPPGGWTAPRGAYANLRGPEGVKEI